MKRVTRRELDHFLSCIDFRKTFLDGEAIDIMNRFGTLFDESEELEKENEKLKEEFDEMELKYLEMYDEIGNALGFNMEDPNHELKDYLHHIDKCVGAETFEENEKLKRDNKRLEQIRQLQKGYLQNLYNLLDDPEDAVHSSSTKVLEKFKAVFRENERLKVALRKAIKELRDERDGCPVWDGLTTFERCTYTEGIRTCGDIECECYEEYFLKEAEKELTAQNMQKLADESKPIPPHVRKKMDEDRLKAEKELAECQK